MRFLLLLAFLLYDFVASYEYDELEGKRHAFADDRRNWRKKALLNQIEGADENVLRGQRRYDTGPGKSAELYERDWKKKPHFNQVEGADGETVLRGQHPYDKVPAKSSELYEEKEQKSPAVMNCDRPHERYEPCFAGCAAVSCDNPRERLRPCYPFCEPGCICVPPYIRDDRTHKCVLPDDCTKGLKGVPDIGEET